MSEFKNLPVIDNTIPGYQQLYCFPKHWPMWKETDGSCWAIYFDRRPGGAYTPETRVCKERVPEEVFTSNA